MASGASRLRLIIITNNQLLGGNNKTCPFATTSNRSLQNVLNEMQSYADQADLSRLKGIILGYNKT
jgi:hypothetical protein